MTALPVFENRSPVSPISDRVGWPAVATYDDYRRALAAVQHLREQGFHDVHLELVDFDEVRVRSDSDVVEVAQRACLPAAVAAAMALVAGAAIGSVTVDGPRPLLLAIVAITSAVTSLVVGVFRGARHGLPVATTRLAPRAYEVHCRSNDARRTSDAERHLAAWWQTGVDGHPMTPDHARLLGG